MGWVKLDEGFFRHPKAVRAGRDGRDLYVAGLCWCASQLTDGHIPAQMLPLLAFDSGVPLDDAGHAASRLVEVGLWEIEPEGWVVHDYDEHQRTRDEVEHEREQARERQRKRRERLAAKAPEQGANLTPMSRRDTSVSHGGVTTTDQIRSEVEEISSSNPLLEQEAPAPNAPQPQTDEEDGVRNITDEIGRRGHAKRMAEPNPAKPIRNPTRHLATCQTNAYRDHAATVTRMLDAGRSADQVLAELAPDPTLSPAAQARARLNGAA